MQKVNSGDISKMKQPADWAISTGCLPQRCTMLQILTESWCEQVTKLCDLGQTNEVQDTVCSVSWSQRGALLAVGTNAGETQLWDIAKNKKWAPSLSPGWLSW